MHDPRERVLPGAGMTAIAIGACKGCMHDAVCQDRWEKELKAVGVTVLLQ